MQATGYPPVLLDLNSAAFWTYIAITGDVQRRDVHEDCSLLVYDAALTGDL